MHTKCKPSFSRTSRATSSVFKKTTSFLKNMLKLNALEELMHKGHGAACDFIRARLGDENCEEFMKLRQKCTWKGWKNIRNKLFLLLLINGFQQDSTQLVADTFMQIRKENASKMDPKTRQSPSQAPTVSTMEEFIVFLAREAKENSTLLTPVMVQKISAFQNLLARGAGPSYEFVNEQLIGKRKARRKSTFIEKKHQYFPHSNLLNQLITKFLSECPSQGHSARERMESLAVQNTGVQRKLSELETVAEISVTAPKASKKGRRHTKVTVRLRRKKKTKKTLLRK